MKNEIYINELSLEGQFENIEDFVRQNKKFILSLRWFQKNGWNIYKKSTLYECQITHDKKMYNLHSWKGVSSPEERDLLRKYKSILLQLEDNPPYWDSLENITKKDIYFLFETDISSSSMAKSCEHSKTVLSFCNEKYKDVELDICKNYKDLIKISSIFSIKFLSEVLYKKRMISINEYINLYYKNTRLNFSKLDEEYGFEQLEKDDLDDCLKSFQRFIEHKNWQDLNKDRTLNYKEYAPSSDKDNWFYHTQYHDKNIYKFRCGNPKRCFGYRENNQFFVLRIEKGHKISDKG